MTDEQIIKNFRNGVYKNKPMLFGQKFLESVLDLINRQKAEIERLREIANHKCQKCVSRTIECAKSEAIKEFAERLKHFIIPQKADGYTREIVLKRDIDNLVKEMTGGRNKSEKGR